MRITGTTRIFYCIADPVDQVRAPEVFNAVFARHEVDAVMVPLRVTAGHLAATLRCLARIADSRWRVAVHPAQGGSGGDAWTAARALRWPRMRSMRSGAIRTANSKGTCSMAWVLSARWIAQAWLTRAAGSSCWAQAARLRRWRPRWPQPVWRNSRSSIPTTVKRSISPPC